MKKGLISNKSLNGQMQRGPMSQAGFTLIELIMVVVILGILAAFALPKFASLNDDSEVAAMEAARGAVKTAMAVTHGKYLASGSTAAMSLDGTSYTLIFGYPSAANIESIAGLDGYTIATSSATPPVSTISINTNLCVFTYTQAADADTPAVLGALSGGSC